MADIVVTAAQVAVVWVEETQLRSRTAGVALTAGQSVYYDSNGKAQLTDANGSATTADFDGIVFHDVAAGGTVDIVEEGWVGGFTLSAVGYGGEVYLSDTPGALATAPSAAGFSVSIGSCDWRNDSGGTFTKMLRVNRRPKSAGQASEVKSAKFALTGAAIAAGTAAWANPEAGNIDIQRVLLQITTASTGASTIDIGTTATSAATSSDNLIDGVSGATAGVFDNISDAGTNGKSRQRLATGKWVTINDTTGDATGLVGNLIIEYVV